MRSERESSSLAARLLAFELNSSAGSEPERFWARAMGRLCQRPGFAWLDSAAGRPQRFDLAAFEPVRALDSGLQTLAEVAAFARGLRVDAADLPGPFAGGFLGALAYDLGAAGERRPACAPEPWGFPLAVGGLYTDFLLRERAQERLWLVLGEDDGDGARESLERRRERLLELLCAERAPDAACAASPDESIDASSGAEASGVRCGALQRDVPAHEHVARVECARAAIARGEIYQVNLAHRMHAQVEGHPFALYRRLRAVNPAPYMGYLRFEQGALLSASPELLLEFDGREARTRPIKGTRPRGGDPERDAALARELLASAKDRAELAMIVDLERNDLGRTAEIGSVRVEDWPRLESYARVHHLMADVVARPRAGVGAFELLAALFPGGSVTGAPKLASMDWIARLEGEGRGFFCGALGFVDTRGRAAFNLLIRTLLWRPVSQRGTRAGEVSFRVGGGVTWSSDARAEERETLDKAAGLVAALGPAGLARADGPNARADILLA